MNEAPHNSSNDRDPLDPILDARLDEQLEARLVALALGEASDFERDELERLMSENAAAAAFFEEVQEVSGLLDDVGTGEFPTTNSQADKEWKLSEEQRDQVLQTLSGDAAGEIANDGLQRPKHPSAKQGNAKRYAILQSRMALGLATSAAMVLIAIGASSYWAQTAFESVASKTLLGVNAHRQAPRAGFADGGGAIDGKSSPRKENYSSDMAVKANPFSFYLQLPQESVESDFHSSNEDYVVQVPPRGSARSNAEGSRVSGIQVPGSDAPAQPNLPAIGGDAQQQNDELYVNRLEGWEDAGDDNRSLAGDGEMLGELGSMGGMMGSGGGMLQGQAG